MINLTILHTNDIHGRISQLSRIATLVRRIRHEVAGGYCVFVDAGDSEDTVHVGSSLTKGSVMGGILRGSGCELTALGNAIPLRYGPQAIADLAKHFGHLILCANMAYSSGENIAGLQPYSIEKYGSLSIGFIGLTAPIDGYFYFDLVVEPAVDVLPDLISQVRASGAKTVILLSHLGSLEDQNVAQAIQDLDVIIGAHDHKILYPPIMTNGTIVVQAGEYGEHLGRLDLVIDPTTGKIISHKGELIPIGADIPLDNKTETAIKSEEMRAQLMMQEEIGTLDAPIELSEDKECPAGNLLADVLLERVKDAQIAIVLAGHWTSGLEAGRLTKGVLYTANRSPANPAWVEITGAQIEQFLREALKPDNISRRLRALRGNPVGMPHIAGMCVRYTPSSLDALNIQIGNEPLQQDKRYIVAATDLEFYDFINYLPLPTDQVKLEVPTIVPEVLEDYIARYSPIQAPELGRILLIEK
jgi:5'-nucleotidase